MKAVSISTALKPKPTQYVAVKSNQFTRLRRIFDITKNFNETLAQPREWECCRAAATPKAKFLGKADFVEKIITKFYMKEASA